MVDPRELPGRSVAIEADGDSYKGFRHHKRDLSLQCESLNRAASIAISAIIHKQLKLARRFSTLYGERLEASENCELQKKLESIDSEIKTRNARSADFRRGRHTAPPPPLKFGDESGEEDGEYTGSGDENDVFIKTTPILTHVERDLMKKNHRESAFIVTGNRKESDSPTFRDMIDSKKIDERLLSERLRHEELFLKNRVMRWKANMARERAQLTDKFRHVSVSDAKRIGHTWQPTRPKSCSAMRNDESKSGISRKKSAPPRLMDTCNVDDVMDVIKSKTSTRHKFPPVKSAASQKPRSAVRWRDEGGGKLAERAKPRQRATSAIISYRLKNNVW